MSEWKGYITVEMMTLIVAIATLIVSIAAFIVAKRAYRYTRKHDRQTLLEKIESKELRINEIKKILRRPIPISYLDVNKLMMEEKVLEAEVKTLRQQINV